jgi:hypothetical protein
MRMFSFYQVLLVIQLDVARLSCVLYTMPDLLVVGLSHIPSHKPGIFVRSIILKS